MHRIQIPLDDSTPHPELRGRFDVLSPAPPRSWLLDLNAGVDRPVVELPQMGQDAGPVDFSLVRKRWCMGRFWQTSPNPFPIPRPSHSSYADLRVGRGAAGCIEGQARVHDGHRAAQGAGTGEPQQAVPAQGRVRGSGVNRGGPRGWRKRRWGPHAHAPPQERVGARRPVLQPVPGALLPDKPSAPLPVRGRCAWCFTRCEGEEASGCLLTESLPASA